MDVQYNGLPARAEPVNITVSTVNGVLVATMPANPGWINVFLGYDISGTGATVGLAVSITTTGLTNNISQWLSVPAGVLLTGSASLRIPHGRRGGSGVAVDLTVPAFGLGNAGASLNLYGYRVPG